MLKPRHMLILIALVSSATFLIVCGSPQNSKDSEDKLLQSSPQQTNLSRQTLPTPSKVMRDKWQTSFHAEEPVKFPIEIPPSVFSTIAQSGRYIPRRCIESLNASDACFVASTISINDDDYADIIVMGQAEMLGANVTPFWIFQGTENGYKLVLSDSGLQLVIGNKKINGFRKIDIVSMSASSIFTRSYEFSGSKYALASEKREDI